MSSSSLNRDILEALVKEHSLVLFGLVELKEDSLAYKRYLEWLSNQKHAGMFYMENYKALRKDPRLMLEGAQSSLVLGYNYYGGDKLSDLHSGVPRIAQYARLKDYHKFLRKKCEKLVLELQKKYPELKARICVDSAPILEKNIAAKSREGFIGKNSLFIHPKLGSYFSLVEVLLNLPVVSEFKEPVDPSKRTSLGGCGSCKRCQVHCPTGALNEDHSLDSSLCLSYYTIEHRDFVPLKFWPHFKKYLFGCDICQLVCPYNRGSSLTEKTYQKLGPYVDLFSVATMDQEFYEKTFGGTPMVRAKKEGLQRNALIAMAVTENPQLQKALALLKEQSLKLVLEETIWQIENNKNPRK